MRAFNAYLESEEFEALMQEYRHARVDDPVHVLLSFAAVQNALLMKFIDYEGTKSDYDVFT